MDPRRPLMVLVSGLFVLVVAFAVLSGASSFSATMGDPNGALWLWRLAIASLLLLVIDGFLLLFVLGWSALEAAHRDRTSEERRRHDALRGDDELKGDQDEHGDASPEF